MPAERRECKRDTPHIKLVLIPKLRSQSFRLKRHSPTHVSPCSAGSNNAARRQTSSNGIISHSPSAGKATSPREHGPDSTRTDRLNREAHRGPRALDMRPTPPRILRRGLFSRRGQGRARAVRAVRQFLRGQFLKAARVATFPPNCLDASLIDIDVLRFMQTPTSRKRGRLPYRRLQRQRRCRCSARQFRRHPHPARRKQERRHPHSIQLTPQIRDRHFSEVLKPLWAFLRRYARPARSKRQQPILSQPPRCKRTSYSPTCSNRYSHM